MDDVLKEEALRKAAMDDVLKEALRKAAKDDECIDLIIGRKDDFLSLIYHRDILTNVEYRNLQSKTGDVAGFVMTLFESYLCNKTTNDFYKLLNGLEKEFHGVKARIKSFLPKDFEIPNVLDSRESPALPKLWNVPEYNPNFTGRKSYIEDLQKRFSSPINPPKPDQSTTCKTPRHSQVNVTVIAACHGLGGVGKTQLATAFAWSSQGLFPQVFWFPAEDGSKLEAAYKELAQDLGMGSDQSIDELKKQMKLWFEKNPGCLLIYDNAPNAQVLKDFLPKTNAHIMITTRYAHWKPLAASVLTVDVFTSQEARQYLVKMLGDVGSTEAELDSLAQTMGYLPLALAQAVAYLENTKMSPRKYLEVYQDRKKKLLEGKNLKELQHEPVFITWDVTMEVISRESILAANFLGICAYFHSDQIPNSLLREIASHPENNPQGEEAEEAAGTLATYSMIAIDGKGGTVSIHRLVQEVTQLHKAGTDDLKQAHQAVLKVYPYGKNQLHDYKNKFSLLPHLETVLKHLDEQPTNDHGIDTENLTILTYLADGYGDLGDYAKKRDFLERALKIKEDHFGPDHPEVAKTLTSLGNAYGSLGDYTKQRDFLERALKINKKHYGPDHPEVAITLTNLGNAYGSLGDYAKQRDFLERALKINKKHYGPDHPEVAATLTNLGIAYGDLGDDAKKQDFLERALTIFQTSFGPAHPHVGFVMKQLAAMRRQH